MGEQGRSSGWISTLGLHFQGEAAKASTSLQSGSHERSSKIFLMPKIVKFIRFLFLFFYKSYDHRSLCLNRYQCIIINLHFFFCTVFVIYI